MYRPTRCAQNDWTSSIGDRDGGAVDIFLSNYPLDSTPNEFVKCGLEVGVGEEVGEEIDNGLGLGGEL